MMPWLADNEAFQRELQARDSRLKDLAPLQVANTPHGDIDAKDFFGPVAKPADRLPPVDNVTDGLVCPQSAT